MSIIAEYLATGTAEVEVYRRVMKTLEQEPFNCRYPHLAIEMIKRKIRSGRKVTREDIIRWGNRERKS